MDSRLMNVIYDDPFDGNYAKYDNDAEFWSSGSDTMGMQLTETLHGILPIEPTDEDFIKDNSVSATTINMQNNKKSFNYGGFAQQHFSAGGAIEIVTVDPNADGYDTESEGEDEDSNDEGVIDGDKHFDDFDRQSQSSNFTFRTRTDSSSIGDYESHTSDYDEDDTEAEKNEFVTNMVAEPFKTLQNSSINADEPLIDMHSSLLAPDNIMLNTSGYKNRTLSTNTISSDADGLDLNIDANNFDLAEFITKDDFTINNGVATTTKNLMPNSVITTDRTTENRSSNLHLIPTSKHLDSDSDSDVIVDVETVEADDVDSVNSLRKASDLLKTDVEAKSEEDMAYIDNVSSDPLWHPIMQTGKKTVNLKMEEKYATQKQNITKSYTVVPNKKKQSDILKGKFNKAKVKPAPKPPANKCKIRTDESQSKEMNAIKFPLIIKETKTGIGRGGKNLALLKHARGKSISETSSEENSTPLKSSINVGQQPSPSASTKNRINEEKAPAQKATMAAQSAKRKLNLEEYKKRREDGTAYEAKKIEYYKIPKLENNSSQLNNNNKDFSKPAPTAIKHSEEVSSIVKTLKEPQKNKPAAVDPITEAKNKVLRMQELKKAQQMRIIESTISSKVPRVTKLLPLREIVKDTPYSVLDEPNGKSLERFKVHPDYEEIIVVSASCNTEISLPPVFNTNTHAVNTATRSLLKSSALLSSISNSFQKFKASDNVKISTNSLISSIQDVVVKKTLPSGVEHNNSSPILKNQSKAEHHGEDTIIMHLRKDRMRKRTSCMATQTDLQPEFPPLSLPKSLMLHKSRERVRRKHHKKFQYHKNRDQFSSSSSNSETSADEDSDHSNLSALTRSHENSGSSSSVERIRVYDSAIGTGGYSSRSSRKHRSSISSSHSESIDRVARGRRQRRTSYKHRSKQDRSPYTSSSYTSDSDRSRSPMYRRSRSRSNSRASRKRRSSYRQNNNFLDRNVSQPAVEERRIVYVGRIEQETTKDMLRRKFLPYGTIKQISIHYKDTGMKYGFVTFERSQDAFAAIDNSSRDNQINMYDVSFGGRRAFCRASYADLDNAGINTYQSFVFPQQTLQPKEEDSFEALLKKMKDKLSANKKPNTASTPSSSIANCTSSAPNTESSAGVNDETGQNIKV